jgi:methionine synthase II (cobalamin-independent)
MLAFYIEALAKALSYEIGGLDADQSARARIATVQIDEPMILQRPQEMPMLRTALETLRAHLRLPYHLTLATYFGDAAPCYTQLQELPVDALGLDFTYSPTLSEVILRQGSRKALQLGLLDGRNTRMEQVDEVAKLACALRDASKQNCSITTSCGLEYLPRDRAQQKISLTAQVAKACAARAKGA